MMRILVTRPLPQGETTAALLMKLGFQPILMPLSKIAGKPVTMPSGNFDGVIVTSVAALQWTPRDFLRKLHNVPIYCVGRKTAIYARSLGLENIVGVHQQATELTLRPDIARLQSVLYLAGERRSATVENIFVGKQRTLTIVETYKTVEAQCDNPSLEWSTVDGVLLYSQFAAALFRRYLDQLPSGAKIICLSERIAKVLRPDRTETILIAAEPNEKALIETLMRASQFQPQ